MSNKLLEWLEQKKSHAIGFIDPRLETCSQIAGSNKWVADAFAVPGLGCHILSVPHHGEKTGGDIHYVTVCGYRMKSKFVLIDARGHGNSAAQLSSKMLGVMGRLAGKPDNQSLLTEINSLIFDTENISALATVAAGTFYDVESTWTYAYAGHSNMLIRRNGNWLELRPNGENSLPAGILRENGYYQTTTTLQVGDWIMMYSEGVLNVVNRGNASRSPLALLKLASTIEAETTEEFFPSFIESLVKINHGADFDDDLTLILIDRR